MINERIIKLFAPFGRGMTLVSLSYRRYEKNPILTSLAGTLNTTAVGKFAIVDRNLRLSWKRFMVTMEH